METNQRMNLRDKKPNSSSPLKIGENPKKERIIFQPSIFRGKLAVSFGEGAPPNNEIEISFGVTAAGGSFFW